MEEWRNLAKMVPGTLNNVSCDAHGLLGGLAPSTRWKLTELATAVQMRRAKAPRGDIGDNLATMLGGAFTYLPFEDLDRAIHELARLGALHARADHAFLLFLYGGQVGVEGSDGEPWQSWKLHHADAVRHAAATLKRLRAATSRAREVEDAIRSARSCPCGSPRWDGWMASTIQLILLATISAAISLHAFRRMRDAVALEFHDAWRIVNRYHQ